MASGNDLTDSIVSNGDLTERYAIQNTEKRRQKCEIRTSYFAKLDLGLLSHYHNGGCKCIHSTNYRGKLLMYKIKLRNAQT